MTKHPRSIAIVGYGSGGQAAALFLSRDGHDVQVFERAPEPRPVGAGFLLQPTGLEALWRLGLLERALAFGAPVERLYGETVAGRPVMDMRYRELEPRLFGLGLQRGTLFTLLDRAWTRGRAIRAGCTVVEVDPAAGTLVDSDGGRHGPFDLVVVADGAASRLRAQVAPARLDRPYPWGAQWCLVDAGAWPWPRELRQRYRQARAMAGMLPVGTHPDDPVPRASFFWSLPASALDADADPAAWRGALEAVWPEAAGALSGMAVPGCLAQARYRDAVHARWHSGRAVLLGDAAHAMSPQLGQGVNMALMDAYALCTALRDRPHLDEALAAYQRGRLAHVHVYQRFSRWLTPLFQSDADLAARLRDWSFHPLTRIPGARGQSLRVLTGTRHGWFGVLRPDPAFLRALATAAAAREPTLAECVTGASRDERSRGLEPAP